MKIENIIINLQKERDRHNYIYLYDKTNHTAVNHLNIDLPPLPHTKKQIEHFNTYTVEAIKQNSSFDGDVLKLGNLIEIKPVYLQDKDGNETLEGYDIYRYASEEATEDEDYDFDADFITTVYLK